MHTSVLSAILHYFLNLGRFFLHFFHSANLRSDTLGYFSEIRRAAPAISALPPPQYASAFCFFFFFTPKHLHKICDSAHPYTV